VGFEVKLTHVLLTLWTLTAIFALLPSWPHLYYRLWPQTSSVLASTIASTVPSTPVNTSSVIPAQAGIHPITPTPPLPDVDPSLPVENGLIIEKIGVRGSIHEGEDWEKILKEGIWRVPGFGTPLDNSQPIILAAHRWGYLEWSNSFRKLNSFYNLTQLKVGDTVSIVWDQRQFEYKIYSTETGTQITDYKANLILYTCQLWNSPVRFFVYADRSN